MNKEEKEEFYKKYDVISKDKMMSEIEVGEYIRTRKGITKIEEVNKGCALCENSLIVDIKTHKHSKNIIDLIEKGDYVNGYKVELSRYDELYYGYVYCGGIVVRTTEAYATFIKDMKYEDIESIVTKEQFNSIMYKVGDIE